MTTLKTPVDKLTLVERVNALTPYEVNRSTLISLFNKSQGNKVTSILSLEQFNEWFSSIQNGNSFVFVSDGIGKIVPLSFSIASDEYFKFLNFTAFEKFDSTSFKLLGMTLSVEIMTGNVYLDTKSAFEL